MFHFKCIIFKITIHLGSKLQLDPETKNGQTVENLCAKINSINIDVITKGAFLYPGLPKSSKVQPADIKNFRGNTVRDFFCEFC